MSSKYGVIHAMEAYVPRVATKAKDLDTYPLFFVEESARNKFLALREAVTCKEHDLRPSLTRGAYHDYDACLMHAIRTVRVVSADNFKIQPDHKIYLCGDGMPGCDRVTLDDMSLTMVDIARKFRQIGVPDDIRDVRLMSSWSADARQIPDISASELSEYSRPHPVETQSLHGVQEIVVKAPAQHLADAMAEQGYHQVTVKGYHGLALNFDGKHFPEHAWRTGSTEFRYKIRASHVAENFTSTIGRGADVASP